MNISKNNKIIISIEGNIGSGKSTLKRILQQKYKDLIYFVDEPVSEWNSIIMDDKGLIEHFYSDNKKYGYLFQNFAYITKLKNMYEAIMKSPHKIIITERSIESDKYLFAKMLYEQNMINKLEWETYNTWYDFFSINIDYFIYVNTNVNNCVKRIKLRNRKGEESIPESYLQELHDKHELWMKDKDNKLEIDGNIDIFDIKNQNKHMKNIGLFILNVLKIKS